MYDAYQLRIGECDRELEAQLSPLPSAPLPSSAAPPSHKRQRAQGNAPSFDLRGELQRICGVDLTRIDGIDVLVAQTILSEMAGT